MGRNLADFYGNVGKANDYTFTKTDGAAISRSGKDLTAVSNEGAEARRTVTRNRDVKKQGERLTKVATGQAKPLRKDRTVGL